MGEDYEAMMNFKLFCGREQVKFDHKPIDLSAGFKKTAEEEEGFCTNGTIELDATISNDDKVLERLLKEWEKPSRIFTRGERKLFIRTVEHHGSVEFTLHDWKGMVEGKYIQNITLVCNTPRQVKLLLRMKNLGKVSYKIRKKYDTGRNKKDCRNAAHD